MTRERRTDVIQVRVSAEEKALIREAAGYRDLSVSEWVRVVAMGDRDIAKVRGGSPPPEEIFTVANLKRQLDPTPSSPKRSPAAPSRPFKCPACSWRTASSKESCPTHRRSPVPAF